jgi:hypothetical protein
LFAFEGSMASGCKKRRFRDPQSVERSIDNSEMPFHKQRVIKIAGEFVYLKIGKVGEKVK